MHQFTNLVDKIAGDLNVAVSVIEKYKQEPVVTIFGSARVPEHHKFYSDTKEIAFKLAKKGLTICTGGGPGLMAAGSKGGFEAGGKTLGLSIKLPHEQESNPYLTDNIVFQNFAQRKIVFSAVSNAYIIVPGGYGTLDEIFEVLTLMQCKIIAEAPVILYGKSFWEPLIDFIKGSLLTENMIRSHDVDRLFVASSVDEAVELVMKNLTHPQDNDNLVPETLIV